MKVHGLFVVCFAALAIVSSSYVVAEDGKEPAVEDHSVWVTSISRLGQSDQFVAGTANGLLLRESTVHSFNQSDPTKLQPIYTHPAAVWCVASTKDGNTVASVDYRGNLVTYDVPSKKATTHEKAFERWCQSMLISPDDKHVVAGNEGGKLISWDLATGKAGKSVELDGHAVTGLAFSPDGKQLAASDGGGHIHLFQWPDLTEAGKIEVGDQTLWCVAFVEGGKILTGCADRHLYQCEAKGGAKAESVAKGTDWITQIAISGEGQVAAAEIGGRLHFPTTGRTDSMDAESGLWALCWNGDKQLFAGTRKNGIVVAGQSWKWAETKKEPEPDPKTEEKPAEEKEEMKEEAKPKDEPKPEAKSKDEAKKEVQKKEPAKKEDKPKKDDKPEAESEKKDQPKADDKPVENSTEDKKPAEKKE